MPQARVRPTDAPHDADVIRVNLQDATPPAGQPARERVEQRERRNVLGSQVTRLVPEVSHVAAGYPTTARDDQSQLVRKEVGRFGWSGGIAETN